MTNYNSMKTLQVVLGLLLCVLPMASASAQVLSDLKVDWSSTNNPNGAWTYREGTNALPAVASWQSTLGGWSSAQPGWARSENGTNRLPFFFRSNGSENFTHDWLAGDIVVHATDTVNGVGNGPSNVIWTSTISGFVTITGNTWIGRNIGRSLTWSLWQNTTQLSSGVVASGDAFDRANPFLFANGSGGIASISGIAVVPGDTLRFQLDAITANASDFAGVNMAISIAAVPEPSTLICTALGALGLAVTGWKMRRRRRRVKSLLVQRSTIPKDKGR